MSLPRGDLRDDSEKKPSEENLAEKEGGRECYERCPHRLGRSDNFLIFKNFCRVWVNGPVGSPCQRFQQRHVEFTPRRLTGGVVIQGVAHAGVSDGAAIALLE